ALLETGIVETIHPAFAHEHLAAGPGGHPPGGVERQSRSIRVAGEESRDLRGILPLEHGTGDIQELTAWREQRPERAEEPRLQCRGARHLARRTAQLHVR